MLQTHGGEIRWRNPFVGDIAPDQLKVRIEKDVRYLEPDRVEKADLYLPPVFAPGKKYPGIVIIHGGGFVGGSRQQEQLVQIANDLKAMADREPAGRPGTPTLRPATTAPP